MIQLTHELIDAAALLQAFEHDATQSGAIVSFSGKVRPSANGEAVRRLHLQAYTPMTEEGIKLSLNSACRRWPLDAVTIVHRVGDVPPGETIVFVAAASAHRRSAFEAVDFLMDYLKTQAAFWKKEITTSGEFWIEPRTEDYEDNARWKNAEVD